MISTTKQQNTHRKFGKKKCAKESFQNTPRKNIDKQKTKKQTTTTTTTTMEDSSSPSSTWKTFEPTGWWAILLGLARSPGRSVCLACSLARWADSSVLLLSFSCNGGSQKRRNDAAHDVRRNIRHEFQETHTHFCFLITKALPRHYQPTFQLSRYKNKLNLLVT